MGPLTSDVALWKRIREDKALPHKLGRLAQKNARAAAIKEKTVSCGRVYESILFYTPLNILPIASSCNALFQFKIP